MATLTVRNLNTNLIRGLRIRAAEYGRSAIAEHREILRAALASAGEQMAEPFRIADRRTEFRQRTVRLDQLIGHKPQA